MTNVSSNVIEKCVVIVGATGFIGKHLLNALTIDLDLKIRILRHRNKEFFPHQGKNIEYIGGDLLDPASLTGFPTEDCTVINLVYMQHESKEANVSAIHNLCQACVRAKIKRLIHCSTAVVAGRTTEDLVDEDTLCEPLDDYEQTKLIMENIIIDNYGKDFEVLILRPTAIFGPGGQNLLKLANSIVKGNRVINYVRSCFYNKRKMNLVSIENVVAALEFLVSYPMKTRQPEIFIISDDEDNLNTYREMELFLMDRFGCRDYTVPVIPLPLIVLKLLLKYQKKRNYNPLTVYSCRKIIGNGFKKEAPLKNSLIKFVEWYKAKQTHQCQ